MALMAETKRMVRQHLFLCGGTGEMAGKTIIIIRDTLALYKSVLEKLDIVYETMDAGGEALSEMLQIISDDKQLNFRDSGTTLEFLALASKVKTKLAKNETFNLMNTASEWFRKELLLTKEELEFELDNGYGRNMILGNLVAGVALKAAQGTDEDKKAGFEAVVNEVLNGTYEVRVAFIGSAHGGEGRTNLSLHPAVLKSMCIEAVIKKLNLQEDIAKEYVEKRLKISVIMFGAAFCFPAVVGLDQNVAGLVAGTLQNFPEDSAEAVDAFYVLEHDQMPVQAREASKGGSQYKHAHAIELVAHAALEDFFSRDDADFDRLKNDKDSPADKAPIIPHYSLPGHGKTNWSNLGLPYDYRNALGARLRFDAVLFYWLQPQLDFEDDRVFESEFLCWMYGAKSAKQLREKVSYDKLKEKVIDPFKTLLKRERIFLEWLKDISLTGIDWNRDESVDESSMELFPVKEITSMLMNPDIQERGMKRWCLDTLTECAEGNEYHTKLTLDDVRNKLVHKKHKNSKKHCEFIEIMEALYDICINGKENRRWH